MSRFVSFAVKDTVHVYIETVHLSVYTVYTWTLNTVFVGVWSLDLLLDGQILSSVLCINSVVFQPFKFQKENLSMQNLSPFIMFPLFPVYVVFVQGFPTQFLVSKYP